MGKRSRLLSVMIVSVMQKRRTACFSNPEYVFADRAPVLVSFIPPNPWPRHPSSTRKSVILITRKVKRHQWLICYQQFYSGAQSHDQPYYFDIGGTFVADARHRQVCYASTTFLIVMSNEHSYSFKCKYDCRVWQMMTCMDCMFCGPKIMGSVKRQEWEDLGGGSLFSLSLTGNKIHTKYIQSKWFPRYVYFVHHKPWIDRCAYLAICEFSLTRKRFPEMTNVLVAQDILVIVKETNNKAKRYMYTLVEIK